MSTGRYARVPAISLDLSIYPRCLGLSEDAFRWYLFECASIKDRLSAHFSGAKAAENHFGWSKFRYRKAEKELTNAGFSKKYELPEGEFNSERDNRTVCMPPVPVLNIDGTGITHEKPRMENINDAFVPFHKDSKNHQFVRVPSDLFYDPQKAGESPLTLLSIDEIYLYLDLLRENREHWAGINPNHVRFELSLDRDRLCEFKNLADFIFPDKACGDRLCISPVAESRTQIPRDKLKDLLHGLIDRHKLFKVEFWIAHHTTFIEERRSIEKTHLVFLHYLDIENITVSNLEVIKKVKSLLKLNKSCVLIGQLCLSKALNVKFKKSVSVNQSKRSLSRFLNENKIKRSLS